MCVSWIHASFFVEKNGRFVDVIIDINRKKEERKKYTFKNKPVSIQLEESKILFPCIALYDENDVAVGFPGYERWYLNLATLGSIKTFTIQKVAYHIMTFCNYLLWETKCDTISDITLEDIRGFLVHFKTRKDGEPRDPDGWRRGVGDVYNFLIQYQRYNPEFHYYYTPENLQTVTIIKDAKRRKMIVKQNNRFSVQEPKKLKKKNRYLLQGYLDLFLFECKKYDPMLTLAVALQAYAGLREGEVVNVMRKSIELKYAGFGRIGSICIDLNENAPFSVLCKEKYPFGSIKRLRTQYVYFDFIQKFVDLYNQHDALLVARGYGDGINNPNSPLFYNDYGKALSVNAYTTRVENLFRNHFVPDLRKVCEANATWAENAPFIEAWEPKIDPQTGKIKRGEYPGSHMFRHWFTMYLVENTTLSHDEIARVWRGDDCVDSMNDYVHKNARMLSLYKECVCAFQESLLEEIL